MFGLDPALDVLTDRVEFLFLGAPAFAQSLEIRKMNALANKVAIVTGASTGIGYETARLFAKEGAAVVVSRLAVRWVDTAGARRKS